MEGLLLLSCPALQMKATACVTDCVGQRFPISGGLHVAVEAVLLSTQRVESLNEKNF